MKKISIKVFVLTILFTLIIGGVAGALVYHVNDAADALKQDIEKQIEQYNEEKNQKIKNDLSHLTQEEIQRMRDEIERYLQEKLSQDYQDELNTKTDEIKNAANQKIEELKKYIDELLKTN